MFAIQLLLAVQPAIFWYLDWRGVNSFHLFHEFYIADLLLSFACAFLVDIRCRYALLIQCLLQEIAAAPFVSDRDFHFTRGYYVYAFWDLFTLLLLIDSILKGALWNPTKTVLKSIRATITNPSQ